MTAAVARPPLFSHLVASRPDREQGSLAATITSVVLHGAVIAAALVLTARVTTPKPPEEIIIPIIPDPVVVPQVRTEAVQRSGGGRSSSAPALPEAPPIASPDFISSLIPKPGTQPVEDISRGREYVAPERAGPEAGTGTGSGEPGAFVVMTKIPRLLNQAEIESLLRRNYPSFLLQAGIGGTVKIWLQLDEKGNVQETRIRTPSGRAEFDEAALRIGKSARFTPAYNLDKAVRVWVEMPIVFNAR